MTGGCDLCGSTQRTVLHERARSQDVVNVVCHGCGHVYVHPAPTEEFHAAMYEGGAFAAEARGGGPDPQRFASSEVSAARRFRRLRWSRRGLGPGYAREVGCGLGSFLALLDAEGWRVQGVEPDPVYAAAGSDAYGIEIRAGTYVEVPRSPATSDLVASFHVIEHVPSPDAFIAQASAELRDEGILYLETPSIERPYGGDLDGFFWAAHVHTFSHRTLAGLLSRHGLSVEASGYADDFLWLVAEKRPDVRPLPLPWAEPREIVATLDNWRRRFEAHGTSTGMASKLNRLLRKTWEEPSDVAPAVLRALRRRL